MHHSEGTPCLLLPTALHVVHGTISCGICLWTIGVISPSCVPSQLLVFLKPLAARVVQEAENALALCEHCSAVAKTFLYYQHCSQDKSTLATVKKMDSISAKSSITCKEVAKWGVLRLAPKQGLISQAEEWGTFSHLEPALLTTTERDTGKQGNHNTLTAKHPPPHDLQSTNSTSCWRYRKFSKQRGWNSMLNWHSEHSYLGASHSSSLCFCPCKPSLRVPVWNRSASPVGFTESWVWKTLCWAYWTSSYRY